MKWMINNIIILIFWNNVFWSIIMNSFNRDGLINPYVQIHYDLNSSLMVQILNYDRRLKFIHHDLDHHYHYYHHHYCHHYQNLLNPLHHSHLYHHHHLHHLHHLNCLHHFDHLHYLHRLLLLHHLNRPHYLLCPNHLHYQLSYSLKCLALKNLLKINQKIDYYLPWKFVHWLK